MKKIPEKAEIQKRNGFFVPEYKVISGRMTLMDWGNMDALIDFMARTGYRQDRPGSMTLVLLDMGIEK